MTTVHYRYASVRGRRLFYREARPAGQTVIAHGVDRDLTLDEVAPGRQR